MSIWDDLPKPFFVLAPMEGVTDHVFRQVVQHAAPADVAMTEFTNAASFCHPDGRQSTASRLFVAAEENPVIAQIWGNNPVHFAQMSKELAASGSYAGIDINLGCPAKDIVKQNACSALIGNEPLVAELIAAAKVGGLPVSVKTRLGKKELQTEPWFSFLLQQDLAAITVHGRTVKEMSKVAAHWDEIERVVELRDTLSPHTKIIGNGDVTDRAHGLQLAAQTKVDGIMIGRGVFHNIYAFATDPKIGTRAELLDLLEYHLQLVDKTISPGRFAALKKFFKIYISGFPGAADLRAQLMETTSLEQVWELLSSYRKSATVAS